MSQVLRRVCRLHLRAPTDTLARRAGALVEDALRTASIPDADGGRVYLIRQLIVPAIRPGDSANTLALNLEQRLATLRSSAVHASDPRAAAADVVYFDDEAQMHTLTIAALALACDQAWFWSCLDSSANGAQSRAERLQHAVLHLAATAPGVLSLSRVLQRAVEEEWIDTLLSAVQPRAGPALLRACAPGLRPVSPRSTDRDSDRAVTSAHSAAHSRWLVVLRRWSTTWGINDERSTWLAAMSAIALQPVSATAPELLQKLTHQRLERAQQLTGTEPPLSDFAQPQQERHEPEQQQLHSQHPEQPLVHPVIEPTISPKELNAHTTAPRNTEWFTSAGGLLFVVQALRHLRFDEYGRENPALIEQGLAAEFLRNIAQRTRTPPDDPILTAILGESDESTRASACVNPLDVVEWINAVRRWCRFSARIGLYSLVRRPARVAYTRTHIDLSFALRSVDIRVRRAGLDLDPGWVPWLDRVVLFHYTNERMP